MQIDSLLGGLDPVWHEGFRRFVDTGELDPRFETELNQNESLQVAVDRVLDAQADAFRELDAASPGRDFAEATAFNDAPASEAATELVAMGVAAAARFPETELRAVADAAQVKIASMIHHQVEAERAHALLSNLTERVGAGL